MERKNTPDNRTLFEFFSEAPDVMSLLIGPPTVLGLMAMYAIYIHLKDPVQIEDLDSHQIQSEIDKICKKFNTNIEGDDLDDDGISNACEKKIGTSLDKIDGDGDLLSDKIEIVIGTDPNSVDSDGDGISDFFDTDTKLGERELRIYYPSETKWFLNLPDKAIGTNMVYQDRKTYNCGQSLISSFCYVTVDPKQNKIIFENPNNIGENIILTLYPPTGNSDHDRVQY